MTISSSQGTFEVSERNYLESAHRGLRRTQTFTLSRLQVLLCVIIVISLIAVTGILTAMFGPGTKDLKYRDPEDCKGKCFEYIQAVALLLENLLGRRQKYLACTSRLCWRRSRHCNSWLRCLTLAFRGRSVFAFNTPRIFELKGD